MIKIILLFNLLIGVPVAAATEQQCVERDFRARMAPPRSQKSEKTCWAFTAAKLYEEEVCLRSPERCGIELSVADIMRCKFTLAPGPAERAVHCALNYGICSETNGAYPFGSSSVKPFKDVWKSESCSQNRIILPGKKPILVVRGKAITSDLEGIGLEPGDEFIEDVEPSQAIRQAFDEDRSVLVAYHAGFGARHAVIVNAMRWNMASKQCEVSVYDTASVLGAYWVGLDSLAKKTYRIFWIRQ